MTLAKLAASTAALLLSSTALMAQEAQSQTYQSVFIDVGGTAVLVPMDVALEACNLDETALQSAFQSRLDENEIDQTQFMAQLDSAMGMTGQGGAAGTGDAAAQDTAAAGAATTGAGDASGTEGTASADAGGATDAAGTTGDAAATDTATADASGAAAGDASDAAAGTETTDTATADASGAAGQDATATGTGTGDVQNVESTAADTTGDAGATSAANADPFTQLAACQIDQARATELQVDMTQTGSSLGFDAATLGIQSGAANQ